MTSQHDHLVDPANQRASRSDKRVQRTHSRVTPLAEEREHRATRGAADTQR